MEHTTTTTQVVILPFCALRSYLSYLFNLCNQTNLSNSHISISQPLYCILNTVPLNCNFIFPRVILRGTTTILQCIPITCLRGPRLLVSCNVHISWKYMRGSMHLVEVHVSWKHTHGSTHMEGIRM